ncbi:endonuclease MutS2 [bacterium]|nr:endonuclease MutS2 [bacterium]
MNRLKPIKYPLNILEFEQIRDKIMSLMVSESGREKFQEMGSFTDSAACQEALDQVTEMRSLIAYDETFPFYPFEDLRISFKKAEVAGAFLQPGELLVIQKLLVMSRQIIAYLKDREEKYPLICRHVKSLQAFPELEKEISRVISDHGEIKDTASPELRGIRRSIHTRESQIRKRLDAILRSMVQKGYAQEDRLTFREGRLLVPMKDSHVGQLNGVIVDQSATGSTLFVEPLEILETNNDLRRLRIQEIREVECILRAVTSRVRVQGQEIEQNFYILTHLDVLIAKASYANDIDGCAAEITDNHLNLKDARHPLLLMSHDKQDVVPLSMELGEPIKTLIITGPNAGGKTVALKTVGLLAIMHAFGMHVPAKPGTQIPLFSQIFADIGDQQSIEQDLSTFSSHIQYSAKIIREVDGGTLVLMDEIGSATDPAEGSALAMTLLKHLTQKSCITIATTHMGALKIFAHREPGVENGSMIFDQTSLKPTYRFQMGVPGSSYAFEIARRYGIQDDILDESQALLGEDRGQLDQLILSLSKEHSRIHSLLEEAERKDSRLSGLIALYQDRLERIKKEADAEKRKLVEEAGRALRDTNARMEQLVKEIRETNARPDTIKRAKQEIRSAKKKVERMTERSSSVYVAIKGDWVLWEGHSGKGEVVSDPDGNQRVLVQWGDIRLKLPVSALKPTQPPKKQHSSITSVQVSRTIRDEIDLRGLSADEAIDALEQYLGDVHSAGYGTVRIIHGKGTGVLRREINAYLKHHRLVKTQRLGNWNEGDAGVTVVELK